MRRTWKRQLVEAFIIKFAIPREINGKRRQLTSDNGTTTRTRLSCANEESIEMLQPFGLVKVS
jgi:hypothetical protein